MNSYIRTFAAQIATVAGIGTLPYAPGTYATLIALCCISFLSLFSPSFTTYVLITCCVSICAFTAIFLALPLFHSDNDPSAIVIDEVVGTCITCAGITLSLKTLFFGFVLFRFFDIVKPFGITRVERIGGALGILADDVLAGLYANALLHLYNWLFI